MKLPENKKERIQVIVLLVVGALAVLYAGIKLGLGPVLKSKKDRVARMEQLQTKVKDAQMLLDQTAGDGPRNHETLDKINDFSDKHILKPRLGENLLLPATEMVERWAVEAGLKLSPPAEMGRSDIPQVESARTAVRAYGLAFSLTCSTFELTRLLRVIEKANPCITVTRLSIVGNPAQPEKHTVNFSIQMPIWADSEMPAKVRAELNKNAKFRKTQSK
jgi:hypothetical protein